MGCNFSYSRLNDDTLCKLCIVHDDIVYTASTDTIRGCDKNATKYYLPERNIGFHIYDKLLYVYSCNEKNYMLLSGARERNISKKIYNTIIEIHRLMENKKIKSVYVINELKRLNNNNNYNSIIVNV